MSANHLNALRYVGYEKSFTLYAVAASAPLLVRNTYGSIGSLARKFCCLIAPSLRLLGAAFLMTLMVATQASAQHTPGLVATATILTLAPDPSNFGQTVNFQAKVQCTSCHTNDTTRFPTGTVEFRDGGNLFGSSTLMGATAGGVTQSLATFGAALSPAGPHSITANFVPAATNDTSQPSSSLPSNQTVLKDTTTTTIASSINPSTAGQPVTFTATVAVATGTGTPTGMVTFLDGATTLGNPVPLSGNTATFTTTALAAGGHSITAVYNGDANFFGSTTSPARRHRRSI